MSIWTLNDERASARRTRRYFEAFGYTYKILDSVPVVEACMTQMAKGVLGSPAYVPVLKEDEQRVSALFNALLAEYRERVTFPEGVAMATADLCLAGLAYPVVNCSVFENVKAAIRARRLSATLSEVHSAPTRQRL